MSPNILEQCLAPTLLVLQKERNPFYKVSCQDPNENISDLQSGMVTHTYIAST
jgi:hypothetical protein